ncbi:hypothetical protein EGW08_016003 [Elysia chlorotica]|uniref:Ubiquitin-like-conjugating enzyme ATG10 n=1 Tax=Elysia chlorotica TaxID=188477 RepID=A0A3S0ZVH5_ELYCH|nr:hypothetical protein EGW08_016003 [Elysia chlorotica]
MMGSGLLSRAEFERQVERFVDISNRINDGWQLVRAANGILYMVKKCVVSSAKSSSQFNDRATRLSSPDLVTTDRPSSFPSVTPHATPPDVHLQLQAETFPPPKPPVPGTVTLSSANQPLHPAGAQPTDASSDLKPVSPQRAYSSSHFHKALIDDAHQFSKTSDQNNASSKQQFFQRTPPITPSLLGADQQAALNTTGEDCHDSHSRSDAEVLQSEVSLCPRDMEMEADLEDESCMTESQPQQTLLTYEYHVLYSDSYSVPVLYLNIFTTDGKLLPLNEVWNLCPTNYQAHIKENKWTTLTQQEHPLLGRPYLQLHPCHTADLMAQVTSGSKPDQCQNYLSTWLSTVGPLIALKIVPAYIFE